MQYVSLSPRSPPVQNCVSYPSTGNLKGAFSLLNKYLNKMEAFCHNNRGLDVGLIINSTKLSIQSIEDGKKIDWDKVPKLESSL